MKPEEMTGQIKDAVRKLKTSGKSITLGVLLLSVLVFDMLVGVNLADYAMLAALALALIALLFFRSRGNSWNKTA